MDGFNTKNLKEETKPLYVYFFFGVGGGSFLTNTPLLSYTSVSVAIPLTTTTSYVTILFAVTLVASLIV
jgi:hypothetical protein